MEYVFFNFDLIYEEDKWDDDCMRKYKREFIRGRQERVLWIKGKNEKYNKCSYYSKH